MRTTIATVRSLLWIGALLSLGGCASLWEGDDNTPPPSALIDFEPSVNVRTLWTRSVGGGADDYYLNLKPAVYAGHIFAADRQGRVYAFAEKSGDELWETDTDMPLSGGPGAGEELVMVGTSDGVVLALNANDGAIAWTAEVSSEVLSAPQVMDGVVVVRTVDGKLYGLDAKNGSELWLYERTVPVLTLRGTSAPAVAPGVAIIGFDGGRLVAVSLENGQPIWETRIALPSGRSELERMVDIDSDPVIVEDAVYVTTFQGRLAAVEVASGNILWARDMSSHAGLGVQKQSVYVTDEQSHVWALDRFNSSSIWRQGKLEARGLTAPVGFKDYVVVGDLEGYVHWMRRDDGQFVARVRVGGDRIIAPPVATSDMLYVYGSGGTLAALQIE